jgi:two-component system, sensor histidine kinase
MNEAGTDPRAAAPAAGCKVLVVDDNVDSAQSMSLLLGLEGYAVECAYDGEEALARAQSFVPEAVLLDLGLPRISGYEVATRLRAAAEASGQPLLLVAVSGYGRDQDRKAAREAGFDLHLTKPADPDEVLRVLAARAAIRSAPAADAAGAPGRAAAGPASGRAAGHGLPPVAPAADAKPDA